MQSAAVISTASLPVALLNGVGGSVFAHFHRLRFFLLRRQNGKTSGGYAVRKPYGVSAPRIFAAVGGRQRK